ncbi:MAG: hypothetical protein P4M14_11340 [Gammaproteobacteria bacterium]|nr:hypothetical protein [Gammaproteobacteria bacterium]
MNKHILLIVTFALLILKTQLGYGEEASKLVNVLTWWGYMDDSTSRLIKEKCNVILSYDTYSSNYDMLNRWHSAEGKYDILIFSNTIYDVLKNEVALQNSNLSKKSAYYNPIIKEKYIKSHSPPQTLRTLPMR